MLCSLVITNTKLFFKLTGNLMRTCEINCMLQLYTVTVNWV
jgi:hypothetical protein